MSTLEKIVISLFFLIKICPTVMLIEDESFSNLRNDKIQESYKTEDSVDNFPFVLSNGTRNKRAIFDTFFEGQEKFYMSSSKSKYRSLVVLGPKFDLNQVDFEPRRKTIVIVHGFLHNSRQQWIADMENAFHQLDDVNTIIVDWSAVGSILNYPQAAKNTKKVGKQIAKMVMVTISKLGNNGVWGPLHLVGHSLGAQICGFAAKRLKKKSLPWKVTRITGLDPARPLFENVAPSLRLDKTDAPFVDVIHSNAMGYGLRKPIGHVDFYPNGGEFQPGCNCDSVFMRAFCRVGGDKCSHERSYYFMTASIMSAAAVEKTCRFWAQPWDLTKESLKSITFDSCSTDVCTEMGINSINSDEKGTFFVRTSEKAPFCSGF